MLGLAKRLKVRILQASTSEVYGDPITHPQTEDYWGNVGPIGLRSCRDEGKRCAETLFFDYGASIGCRSRWRASSTPMGRACTRTTGGWCRISSCRHCWGGTSRSIYGDGSQTRAFCYVDDMIDGLIRLMKTPRPSPALNIGNPHGSRSAISRRRSSR